MSLFEMQTLGSLKEASVLAKCLPSATQPTNVHKKNSG